MSERSYASCQLGFATLKSAGEWKQIGEHLYELQEDEFESKRLPSACMSLLEKIKFKLDEEGCDKDKIEEVFENLKLLFVSDEENFQHVLEQLLVEDEDEDDDVNDDSEEESSEHECLSEHEEKWEALVMNASDASSICDEAEEDDGDHKQACMKIDEKDLVHKFIPPPFWKEKNWFGDEEGCVVNSVQSVAKVTDVFDEDPQLGVLFAEEDDDDGEPIAASPLVEDHTPSEFKPVTKNLNDEVLDSIDTPPFSVFVGASDEEKRIEPKPPYLKLEAKPHDMKKIKTGIGVPKKGEPRVEKKHKVRKKRSSSQGSRKKEEELVLDDVAKPYVVPQRRFKDMKKEVSRKDIIK
jgi:hypothetical protein